MKKYFKILFTAVFISALCLSGCGENSSVSDSGKNNDISVASDTNTESTAPSNDESEKSEEEQNTIPPIEDPTPDSEGEYINNLLVYNGVAYEQFFGNDDMAENYADVISTIRNSLDDSIKIYNVLVPTHCGVTLPDKFRDTVSSQEDYLNKITSSYSADGITPVNTYPILMQHRNEYLYFNTDHHWTGRAAYYAYADFCRTAGIDAIPMENMTSKKIENYRGSLADSDVDGLNNLKEDYVEYFTVDKDIDTMLYDADGNEMYEYSLIYESAEGSNAYGAFLGGDQPLIVSENHDGNGKKIAVVKESYGNAFAPLIAYTYSETHIIDFRYFDRNLNQYLADNDIDEIIFINNAMATATYQRCEELQSLVN